MTDISHVVEPGDLAVCPLCDNEMQGFELVCMDEAHGAKALAHRSCVDALGKNEE